MAATPSSSNVALPGPDAVDLYLTVDVAAATVQPSYAVINNGVSGPVTNVGGPLAIPSGWLGGTSTGLAVGIISTSAGPAPEFPATWDLIEVTSGGGGGGTSVASDTFTRTLTGAWGTADVGGAWSVLAGNASNFAVNGSRAPS